MFNDQRRTPREERGERMGGGGLKITALSFSASTLEFTVFQSLCNRNTALEISALAVSMGTDTVRSSYLTSNHSREGCELATSQCAHGENKRSRRYSRISTEIRTSKRHPNAPFAPEPGPSPLRDALTHPSGYIQQSIGQRWRHRRDAIQRTWRRALPPPLNKQTCTKIRPHVPDTAVGAAVRPEAGGAHLRSCCQALFFFPAGALWGCGFKTGCHETGST